MASTLITWGFNPGQHSVKNTFLNAAGKKIEAAPFAAVLAPWAAGEDFGFNGKGSTTLEATVNGARYLGGVDAQRLPGAIRQMSSGRLDDTSPLYPAFAQMSLVQTKIAQRGNGTLPQVAIATALPVDWLKGTEDDPEREERAKTAMARHIRAGLQGRADVRGMYISSELGAVVYHEVFDDDGQIKRDNKDFISDLVCVGDIGGGTLNRGVLDGLKPLRGQSKSPLLGSRQAIEQMAETRGVQFIDAERDLLAEIKRPGSDAVAGRILKQYREAVVSDFQQAWSTFKPTAYLFAGGTVLWVADALKKAFGTKARIVSEKPQQAIATGLWRYAQRQVAKQK